MIKVDKHRADLLPWLVVVLVAAVAASKLAHLLYAALTHVNVTNTIR